MRQDSGDSADSGTSRDCPTWRFGQACAVDVGTVNRWALLRVLKTQKTRNWRCRPLGRRSALECPVVSPRAPAAGRSPARLRVHATASSSETMCAVQRPLVEAVIASRFIRRRLQELAGRRRSTGSGTRRTTAGRRCWQVAPCRREDRSVRLAPASGRVWSSGARVSCSAGESFVAVLGASGHLVRREDPSPSSWLTGSTSISTWWTITSSGATS